MSNNIKLATNDRSNYFAHYSLYDTAINVVMLHNKKRKSYIRNEFINLDFVYGQDRVRSKMVRTIHHVEL